MTAAEVGGAGLYKCPLCTVQTTADVVDIGWIACPMLGRQVICMGCCYDYAGIAKSESFTAHPFFDDFRKLSLQAGVDVNQLRIICLNHQAQMYLDAAERAPTKDFRDEMLTQLENLRNRLRSLGH